ncbi:class I SAM-dependent methyltransferase [Oceanobacillus salinisoli]|uniref:class I SAM-dependent methyltransferase n=1 Tax=Oceanobacillus salinisoli TaxID=2678611 RepID=UPI0012E1E12A|nr:class I SAM-dependent methyltransferase [Oceanobacillus salinisoli]
MNNNWNRVIYRIWAPVYDKFFNSGMFVKARKKTFQGIDFKRNSKILFVGVGTGADLELINDTELDITAIDFSEAMLERAREKFSSSTIKFIKMDAQNMSFESHSFDMVAGSLILSVVPNANTCFQEMIRVLKPGGKLIIFDKFSSGIRPSLGKRLMRPIIKVLGTDIGLNFETLFEKYKDDLRVIEDKPVMLGGMYRKIIIQKQG